MIFGAPSDIFSLRIPATWPVWVASIVSITISSVVAIAILGYVLLSILGRRSILEPLKSRGLKVASQAKKGVT